MARKRKGLRIYWPDAKQRRHVRVSSTCMEDIQSVRDLLHLIASRKGDYGAAQRIAKAPDGVILHSALRSLLLWAENGGIDLREVKP